MKKITQLAAAHLAARPILRKTSTYNKLAYTRLVRFLSHASHNPKFFVQDNFTVATVNGLRKTFVGVAKRNPSDIDNPVLGENIAHIRALRRLGYWWLKQSL